MKSSTQNFSDSYQLHRRKAEKSRLHEKFRVKKFSERNLRKYWASRVLSYVTNLFSIATGFTFLLIFCKSYVPNLLSDTIAYFLAGAISLTVLFSVECFKRESIYDYYVEGYLKEHKVLYLSIFFNIGLIIASVFLSVKGADLFVRISDRSIEEIALNTHLKQDSIQQHYQSLIEPYQQKISHYASVAEQRAKAHVWGRLTEEENQDLTFANQQVQRYEKQRNQLLQDLKESQKIDSKYARQSTNRSANYMIWFAGINEIACLLLIFFVHYYEYRKWHEHQEDVDSLDEIHIDREKANLNPSLNQDTPAFDLPQNNSSLEKEVVGFKPSYSRNLNLSCESRKEFKTDLDNLKAFLKKYANVVRCVNRGLSNAKIAKECKVSVSTVHNVKRCMRTVQAYTNQEVMDV